MTSKSSDAERASGMHAAQDLAKHKHGEWAIEQLVRLVNRNSMENQRAPFKLSALGALDAPTGVHGKQRLRRRFQVECC